MGNLDTHDFTCRSICIESKMIVLAVDYSLSPEYKFPYALNEAKYVLKSIPSFEKEFKLDLNNIFVCGDSAGGNLAAVLAINSSKKMTVPYKGTNFNLSLRRFNFVYEVDGYFFRWYDFNF